MLTEETQTLTEGWVPELIERIDRMIGAVDEINSILTSTGHPRYDPERHTPDQCFCVGTYGDADYCTCECHRGPE